MRMLAEFCPEFVAKMDEWDALFKEMRPIDEKPISLFVLLFRSKDAVSRV